MAWCSGTAPVDRDVFWHSVSSDFAADHTAFAIENSAVDEIFLNATSRSDGVGDFGTVVAYRYNVGMVDNVVIRFAASGGLRRAIRSSSPMPHLVRLSPRLSLAVTPVR